MEANRMVTHSVCVCVCVTCSKIIENLQFGHKMHSCIWYDALNKQQFFHRLTNQPTTHHTILLQKLLAPLLVKKLLAF